MYDVKYELNFLESKQNKLEQGKISKSKSFLFQS